MAEHIDIPPCLPLVARTPSSLRPQIINKVPPLPQRVRFPRRACHYSLPPPRPSSCLQLQTCSFLALLPHCITKEEKLRPHEITFFRTFFRNFSVPLTSLSPHSSLHCHSLSTVREWLSHTVTSGLFRQQPTSHRASCISWHNIPGAMWQLQATLCKLPILQEERNLFA